MKLSVIIPTYNDWPRLVKCLEALDKQSMPKDRYEVIVVDNSEAGIIPSGIVMPECVKLVHEPKPGSYVARNKGVDEASGQILAFTDSDCIPDEDWLASGEACFDQSTCDLVGGKVKIFQNEAGNKYGYLYESVTAFHQHRHVPEGRGVTANLFVKKSVFDEAGGFSSTIKSGGDWEFTLRCTDMGYDMIYSSDVLVLHPARTLTTIFKKQRRLVCGGAVNAREKYGHSYLRIMGSHLIHAPKIRRDNIPEAMSRVERAVIFAIDITRYLYRTLIYGGLVLRLINPNEVRE
ncbi:glycosyltransferase [Fodinibius sediminis]|uniref:Glycosyl transferase family 2 n=1 Tax=Fodinibius sediminis TaxID=1214077 RepID=A0A521B3N0_9BACT|nr:glycosyltransferase [Fodinibius sediminis]SMO41698.1 Glycosyl transferase family 2 [Fodinibius sediminis]